MVATYHGRPRPRAGLDGRARPCTRLKYNGLVRSHRTPHRTVLTTYVNMIMGGSNTAAGIVDGAWGLVSIAVALPVGRAADKSRRKSRIIAVGGLLTPLGLAVASSAFAVIYGVQRAEDAELPR